MYYVREFSSFVILTMFATSLAKIDETRDEINNKIDTLGLKDLLENFKIYNVTVEEACARDLTVFNDAMARNEIWMQKLITSKVLENNDECLNVEAKYYMNEIRVKHCIFTLNFDYEDVTRKPLYSICLPNSCRTSEVHNLLNVMINSTIGEKDVYVDADAVVCLGNDKKSFYDTEFVVWRGLRWMSIKMRESRFEEKMNSL